MATRRQRETHDGVAGLKEGKVDGKVCRRARIGLNVRVLSAEELLRAVDGETLDLVDHLVPLVIATTGVALGVLVDQYRTVRFEH
jgi:hypothetical protein